MASVDLAAFLLPLLAIIAGAAVFRWLAVRLGQPAVLGEILLGLLLGASFLGWLWPGAQAALFPAEARAPLEVLGWIGLVLFMFHVGAEMQWKRGEGRATATLALGALVVPLAAGIAVAWAAPGWFLAGEANWAGVVLVASVVTVSALPVLGRILADVGLLHSRLGTLVLGAGTIDDLFAWTLLALVVGAGTIGLTGSLPANALLVGGLFLGALALDRALPRLLARWSPERHASTPALFAALLVAIFASAWLTHTAGLHAVLGPLALGAIVSRHPVLLAYAQPRLQGLTMLLFLPAFFVLAGLDTDLTLLGSATGLAAVLAMFAAASAAKVVGCWLGAKAARLPPREGIMAGILLNARGAVGLVVAKVGQDTGLLSAQGYALLVAVIVLTTLAAPPALALFLRWTGDRQVPPAPASVGSAFLQPLPPELRLDRGRSPEPRPDPLPGFPAPPPAEPAMGPANAKDKGAPRRRPSGVAAGELDERRR